MTFFGAFEGGGHETFYHHGTFQMPPTSSHNCWQLPNDPFTLDEGATTMNCKEQNDKIVSCVSTVIIHNFTVIFAVMPSSAARIFPNGLIRPEQFRKACLQDAIRWLDFGLWLWRGSRWSSRCWNRLHLRQTTLTMAHIGRSAISLNGEGNITHIHYHYPPQRLTSWKWKGRQQ